MAALLIKDSVNAASDAMGFTEALRHAFHIHELGHAHWAAHNENRFPVGLPPDVPDWRTLGAPSRRVAIRPDGVEGSLMEISLADRTILVTGGGSGIGKGVAAAAVAAGGNVMIVGRNADKLAAAAEEIKSQGGAGSVLYEPADVTNEDETAGVVDAATAWHGRLHGVVHCAGGSETIGPITQIDSEAWRRTVDLNVNGSMYVLKHAARELVRGGGGSFVGISSIAASNTHR